MVGSTYVNHYVVIMHRTGTGTGQDGCSNFWPALISILCSRSQTLDLDILTIQHSNNRAAMTFMTVIAFSG